MVPLGYVKVPSLGDQFAATSKTSLKLLSWVKLDKENCLLLNWKKPSLYNILSEDVLR